MRFVASLIASALLLATAPALASAPLNPDDSSYLTGALQTQLGRYALATYEVQHGSGSAKTLAQSIATQSSGDLRTLTTLAKQNNVDVPKGPAVRDSYHYSQMSGMKGKALDQEFLQDMQIDDQMRISTDQDEMQSGANDTLKTYAKHRYTALQTELNALSHAKS